jgi:hypothetical protein
MVSANEILKKMYCEERRKLEEMPIYKNEEVAQLCKVIEGLETNLQEELSNERIKDKIAQTNFRYLLTDIHCQALSDVMMGARENISTRFMEKYKKNA